MTNAMEELAKKRPVIAARMHQHFEKYGKIDYRQFIDAHHGDPEWLRDLIKQAAEHLVTPPTNPVLENWGKKVTA